MNDKKCCFCLRLETGCVLLGVVTFLTALLKTSLVIGLLSQEEMRNNAAQAQGINTTDNVHRLNHILNLALTKPVIDVTLSLILVIGVLWMLFSAIFVVGMLKRNPSHVISYFLFGTALCIMFLLTGLLEGVNGMWRPCVVTICGTMIYIKCLVSVYTAYELLLEEKIVNDREQLICDEDFSIGEQG